MCTPDKVVVATIFSWKNELRCSSIFASSTPAATTNTDTERKARKREREKRKKGKIEKRETGREGGKG